MVGFVCGGFCGCGCVWQFVPGWCGFCVVVYAELGSVWGFFLVWVLWFVFFLFVCCCVGFFFHCNGS